MIAAPPKHVGYQAISPTYGSLAVLTTRTAAVRALAAQSIGWDAARSHRPHRFIVLSGSRGPRAFFEVAVRFPRAIHFGGRPRRGGPVAPMRSRAAMLSFTAVNCLRRSAKTAFRSMAFPLLASLCSVMGRLLRGAPRLCGDRVPTLFGIIDISSAFHWPTAPLRRLDSPIRRADHFTYTNKRDSGLTIAGIAEASRKPC